MTSSSASGTTSQQKRSSTGEAVSKASWMIPLTLLGAFVVIFGLTLWLTHHISIKAHRTDLQVKAESIAESIRLRMKGNTDYLLLLAAERSAGRLDSASFQERASQYVKYHPELLNITWVDQTYVIHDVAPLAPNRQIVGLELNLPEPKRASRLARETRRPAYTRPFEAIQGKTSFEIWIPVYQGERFLGLFGGVYSCDHILKQFISQEQRKNYHLSLLDASGRLLSEVSQTGSGEKLAVYTILLTSKDSGVQLRFTGYREVREDWRLLVLELLCLALVLGMAYALWKLKREIEVRRTTEDALKLSQARLEESMQQARMAYWEYDAKSHEFIFNDTFYEMLGTSAEREGGERMHADLFASRFLHPEEKHLVDDAIHNALTSAATRDHADTQDKAPASGALQFTVQTRIGEEKTISLFSRGITNEKGQLAGAVNLGIDITEQVRAHEAVRTSEKRLRELLENTHLVAVFLDQHGRVTYCNQFLLNVTGRSREEVIGASWFDMFVPQELAGELKAAFEEGFSKQEIKSQVEIPLVTRQGKHRTIVWDTTFLHQGERTSAGIACIGIDVTSQRNLEEQLRQSQKMEAIGQLAGGVAHDFNNILTVIIGVANILQIGTPLDQNQKEQVDHIIAAAERAAQLTNGLLTFSRKQVMDPKTLNLNNIVQQVRQFLSRIIGEDIHLKTVCSEAELNVYVDQSQIEQMLINLATNSRDAMPKGGRLTVETTQQEVDPAFAATYGLPVWGPYAVLTVSDTGAGMDEEVRTRIFEPFYTTKEVGKGTGLGMSIVYGIVKQHKGHINVYSEPGQGTTFMIYLPLVAKEAPEDTAVPGPIAPTGGSETILLAEDDVSVRNLVEKILTSHGYKVILAEDGQDAVVKFQEHQDEVRLIVMDMVMPKKSGKEAYEEIRKLRKGVRVLYSSGYPRDFIQNREELEKGTELFMKPVQPLELLKKIREMLDAG